jgi:hypothetical protein
MNALTIKEKIANSYLLGCIKYKNDFTFYLMPIAYWILNHNKYDPYYNPNDWEYVFRDNILNVDDDKVEGLLKSIDIDKIDLTNEEVKEYGMGNIFLFFIDFDWKFFVSYFPDISVEEYLPNEKWIGKFDNPIGYLPQNLQMHFNQ